MDIWHSFLNFLLLTILGLFIAFNPSLIALNLLIVLKSKNPIKNALVLILGVAIPLVVVALLSIYWIKPDDTFRVRGSLSDVGVPPLIDMMFGLSLLSYASFRQLRQRNTRKQPSTFMRKSENLLTKTSSIFMFGLVRSSLSITNLLAVVVIAKMIIVNDASPIIAAAGIIWALAIGLLPLVAAPFMRQYKPDSLMRAQPTIDRLLSRDTSSIITIILAIAGLVFFIHGAANLKA